MLAIIKRIAFITFISLLFILLSVSIYIYFNEKKISTFIVASINNKIDSKISASKINISLFKNFPNVSLSFSDIEIESSHKYLKLYPKSKPLVKATNLVIHFNLYQLLHNNLILNGLTLENGNVNIYMDDHDNNNYVFWKTDTSSQSNLNFALSHIVLRNINFGYFNRKENLNILSLIETLSLKGIISKKNISSNLKLNAVNSSILSNDKSYKLDNLISISSKINYNNDYLALKKVTLKYNDIEIVADFTKSLEKYSGIFELSQVHPETCISFVDKRFLENYNISKGTISAKGTFDGNINRKYYKIDTYIALNKVNIEKDKFAFHEVTGELNLLLNNKNIKLQTKKLEANLNESHFNLSGVLNKGRSNNLKVNIKSLVQLNNFNSFIDNNFCKFKNGEVNMTLGLESLKSFSWDSLKVANFDISAEGKVEAASGNIYYNNYIFSDLQAVFLLKNQIVKVTSASGEVNRTPFTFRGKINNLAQYFEKKNKLAFDGSITCDSVDIKNLLLKNETPVSNSNLGYQGNLRIFCKLLKYNNIHCLNLNSEIEVTDNECNFKNLKTDFCEGQISKSNFKINYNSSSINITTDLNFDKINIKTLFKMFNNFDQRQLLADNIRGNLNGKSHCSMTWDGKNRFISEQLAATTTFEIQDGLLTNFKPIQKLAMFLEIDDINHIKFNNIKNNISISNRLLSIPEMEIQSNAFNLKLSGNHTFNNEYEYHFNMLLSEILFRKIKKKDDGDFGKIEDRQGRTKVFVKLLGKDDKFKISYDNKLALNSFSKNMSEEKTKLKKIFSEEFHLFKKDSLKKTSNSPKIKIEDFELKPVEKYESKKPLKKTAAIEWKDE